MPQTITKPETTATPRLPCRGCLPRCANYTSCDGKLWRAGRPPRQISRRSGQPRVLRAA